MEHEGSHRLHYHSQHGDDQSLRMYWVFPGRDSIGNRDPTRPLRNMINEFKSAVHTDKIMPLVDPLDEQTQQRVFKACTYVIVELNELVFIDYSTYVIVKRV